MGVALADPRVGSVRPLVTLRRQDAEHEGAVLARLVAEHGVTELVVGLPLHMSGDEGVQALQTRAGPRPWRSGCACRSACATKG